MDYRRIVNQVVVGVAVAVLASAAQADLRYVDDDNCPGPGDGSELDPYCSIQTAIDNAVDTDEIVVAPGTYFEAINFHGKAITVRSSDPDDPDVVAATIIDGTGNLHVVQCVSGEWSDTVLSGFVITGGNANGDSFPDFNGGGMLNSSSSPTVTNCTFSGNWAKYGGGMFNYNSANPTVTDCMFSGNEAETGGGGIFNNSSSPTVSNCTFSGNEAETGGGGMNTYSGAPGSTGPTVTDSAFCGNSPRNIAGQVVLIRVSISPVCPIPVCRADCDGDGVVNVVDFLDVIALWGPCPE
ncbi:MAG: right-handed parallel beta-helix repeat-containing protein [Planctomycetota bacterium]|jgi:parallel beta-helix repeat protein